MATFLATRKMSPEFRARLEASVRGKRRAPDARLAPRSRSWLRLTAISASIAAVIALFAFVRKERAELEAARSELIERARREAAPLTNEERRTPERVKSWLGRLSGPYSGDSIAQEIRGTAEFSAALSRSIIYVRGPLESFRNPNGLAESAGASLKDALVTCLMDPPASRGEKALLVRARTTYGRSGRPDPTAQVTRLRDALAGMPLLGAEFLTRVQGAEHVRELSKLEREFTRAPLAEAKRAAKSDLLLFAMDEPATRPGPVELDGERAHDVRVGLVDLRAERLLLQLRFPVDPSFISVNLRVEYAGPIDSCALALDVRAAVTQPAAANATAPAPALGSAKSR